MSRQDPRPSIPSRPALQNEHQVVMPPKTSRVRRMLASRRIRLLTAGVLLLGVVASVAAITDRPGSAGPTWRSGAWVGGGFADAGRVASFGDWRGRPADTVLYFPERGSWAQLRNSDFHVATWKGFEGTLVYGVPLLPSDGSTTLAQVAAGEHDEDFRAVARTLLKYGRGDAVLRIGWEANGDNWWPWDVDANGAADYRAAFRRVTEVMRSESPDFVIDFDISCGTGLAGSTDRTAALSQLYPGDSHVDVIGCDVYDFYETKATNAAEWAAALRPKGAPGLADVMDFASQHRKPFSVPEWGLSAKANGGNGDNPFYIRQMYDLFTAHAGALAYEQYFNEPDAAIANGLWSSNQNPRSSDEYRSLW